MSNMKSFLESLEKNTSKQVLSEDALEVVKGGKGWYYVPKQSFLNGILRVAVHEVSEDSWEILYCAPESKATGKAKEGGKGLMAHKEIETYQTLLKEEVEGSPNALKGWVPKTTWKGNFEECLKKCVDLVQGKSSSVPTAFKK